MKPFFVAFSLIVMLSLVSCHDNGSEPEEIVVPVPEPEEKELPDINGKVYGHEDNFMLDIWFHHFGGSAKASYGLSEGQHAEIKLLDDKNGVIRFYTDDFDLSKIEGNTVDGIIGRPSFWGFGKEISIPVKFVPDKENGCYRLNGNVVYNSTEIELTDVIIDEGGLSGIMDVVRKLDFADVARNAGFSIGTFLESAKYSMVPTIKEDGSRFSQVPIEIVWNSSEYPEEMKSIVTPDDFLQILLNTPYLSASDYGFKKENKFITMYVLIKRIIGVFTFPYYMSDTPSSFGMGTYVKDGNSYIFKYCFPEKTFFCSNVTDLSYFLSIDPLQVFSVKEMRNMVDNMEVENENISRNTESMNSLLSNLMLSVSSRNVEGLLMTYSFSELKDEEGERFFKYITSINDKAISIAFVKALFCTVLSNELNRQRLKKAIIEDENLVSVYSELSELIDNYENVFESTDYAKVSFVYRSSFLNHSYGRCFYEEVWE